MTDSSPYPHGLRVFLRTQASDGSLHYVDLPTAIGFKGESDHFIFVVDGETKPLGIFVKDATAFILPLQKTSEILLPGEAPLAKN